MPNNKSKGISFTVTIEEYEKILLNARARGLTPSQFSKMVIFEKLNKHSSSGSMAKLHAKAE
jgi:hypothetical protein